MNARLVIESIHERRLAKSAKDSELMSLYSAALLDTVINERSALTLIRLPVGNFQEPSRFCVASIDRRQTASAIASAARS